MERRASLSAANLLRRVLAGDVEITTCALCLCDESLMPSALPVTLDTGQTITVEQLANDVQLCLANGKIFAGIPCKKICLYCIDQMKSFYEFKKKCINTAVYLQNFINTLDKDTTVATAQLMELYPDHEMNSLETFTLHIISNLKTLKRDGEEIYQPASYTVLRQNNLTVENLICDHCKHSFKNKYNLRKHISSIHSSVLNSTDSDYIKKLPHLLKNERSQNTTQNKYRIEQITHIQYNSKDIDKSDHNILDPLRLVRDPLESIQETVKEENEMFECRKCTTNLSSLDELYDHMRKHRNSPYHICRLCARRCNGLQQLLAHWKCVHSEMPPLTPLVLTNLESKSLLCCFCKATFQRQFELKNHIYNYHDTKMMVCPDCHAYFPNRWTLSNHKCQRDMLNVAQEVPKGKKNEVRDVGDFSDVKDAVESSGTDSSSGATKSDTKQTDFLKAKNLIAGADDNQKILTSDLTLMETDPSFEATKARIIAEIKKQVHSNLYPGKAKCKKIFPSKTESIKQEATQPTDDADVLCHAWSKTFGTSERSKCLKTTRKVKMRGMCPVCGHMFNKLQQHMRIHSKLETVEIPKPSKKLPKCDVCGSMQRSYSDLKDHKKQHEAQEKCPVCSKMLCTTQMRSHLDEHEKLLKPKLQCPDCNFSTIFVGRYERHLSYKHDKPKSLKCVMCAKAFCAKETLETHKLTHGEFLLSCAECKKKFRSIRGHQLHMMKHIGLLKFPCQLCGKRFVRAALRNQHQLAFHKKPDLKCSLCQEMFSNSRNLRKHMRKDHDAGRRHGATEKKRRGERNVFVIFKKPAGNVEANGI